MNINRFEVLAHSAAGVATRRSVVRALMALIAGSGLLPARSAGVVAKTSRRRKKRRCGPCQRRTKGRCRAKPAATPCGECGRCLAGVCTPSTVECGGICTVCDDTARCRTAPDGTTCSGNGTCLNGGCSKPV